MKLRRRNHDRPHPSLYWFAGAILAMLVPGWMLARRDANPGPRPLFMDEWGDAHDWGKDWIDAPPLAVDNARRAIEIDKEHDLVVIFETPPPDTVWSLHFSTATEAAYRLARVSVMSSDTDPRVVVRAPKSASVVIVDAEGRDEYFAVDDPASIACIREALKREPSPRSVYELVAQCLGEAHPVAQKLAD